MTLYHSYDIHINLKTSLTRNLEHLGVKISEILIKWSTLDISGAQHSLWQ